MMWLTFYVVAFLVLLGLLFTYAWHRHLPKKCYSCGNYDGCAQRGKCESLVATPGSSKYPPAQS